MITLKKSKRGGFTLIELLVAMAIIMILGGLLYPVIAKVKNDAKNVKAKADVRQLDIALKAILADYREWPTAIGGPSTSMKDVGSSVIAFLNGTDPANTKKVCYMEFDKGSMNNLGFVDPWKQLYKIALGSDGTVTPSGASASALPRPCAAWSLGPPDEQKFVTSW